MLIFFFFPLITLLSLVSLFPIEVGKIRPDPECANLFRASKTEWKIEWATNATAFKKSLDVRNSALISILIAIGRSSKQELFEWFALLIFFFEIRR